MENPGFYSLSKKVKEWQTMQQSFEKTIREALGKIGCCVDDQEIEFYLSFLLSTASSPQDPHIDYKWCDVLPMAGNDYTSESYRLTVPFIGLFPTSKEGMRIDIWPHKDHRKDELKRFTKELVVDCENWIIPYGYLLLVRGDTVHAGGYALSQSGTPRCHIYVHKVCRDRKKSHLKGIPYDPLSSNLYRISDDSSSQQLEEFYIQASF
jgi:hypothetical protein